VTAKKKEETIDWEKSVARLEEIVENHAHLAAEVRGVGLIQGIACETPEMAGRICRAAFEAGVVMETAGPEGHVAKVMPPLNIDEVTLKDGLELLDAAVRSVASVDAAGESSR